MGYLDDLPEVILTTLAESNILELRNLEWLDLQDNLLTSFSSLCVIIDNLASQGLRHVVAHSNAAYPSLEDSHLRHRFLSNIPFLVSPQCRLVSLNGQDIVYKEKLRIVREKHKGSEKARLINTLLFLECQLGQQDDDAEPIRILALPRLGIRSVFGFERFSHLTALDISHNSIRSIHALCKDTNDTDEAQEVLPLLRSLQILDLRFNEIVDLAETTRLLQRLPLLSHLFLFKCTRHSSDSDEPQEYSASVFGQLHSLRYLDGLSNCFSPSLRVNQTAFLSSGNKRPLV